MASLVAIAACARQVVPAGVDASAPDSADDTVMPASVSGYFTGVWSSTTGLAGERPELVVFDMARVGTSLQATVQDFEPLLGTPEVYQAQGTATTTSHVTLSAMHLTPGCQDPTGAQLTIDGDVSASDFHFVFSGHNCEIEYMSGSGTARRAIVTPETPRIGVTGFYSGFWLNYPTPSYGTTIAISLLQTSPSGGVTATLHTYNGDFRREVFLTGSGTAADGTFDIMFTGGGTCVTSMRLTGTAAHTFNATMNGTDCNATYTNITISIGAH